MKQKNEKQKRSLSEHLHMIVRGYKMLFSLSKACMVWRTLNCIVQQLSPYVALYMSSLIINELLRGAAFERLITLAAVTVLSQFAIAMLVHVINRFAEKYDAIIWQYAELWYQEQQNRMKYEYLDDADITMLRTRIQNASNYGGNGFLRLYWSWWNFVSGVINVLLSVSLSLSLFITFSAQPQSGFFAFINSPWSGLCLLAVIALNIYVSVLTTMRSADYWTRRQNELSKRFMRSNGYWNISWGMDSLIFNLRSLALPYVQKTVDPPYRNETEMTAFRRYQLPRVSMLALMDALLFLFVGAKAYIGVIGIGSLLLYRGTVERFTNACRDISESFVCLFKNNDYMQDVFDFFDLPQECAKGDVPLSKDEPLTVEFRNVTFRYPKTDVYALKNVSCTFRAGDKIAMVGRNGSGKTTLIKLLCRLYEPTEGEILLGGKPISAYKYEEYIDAMSVVFQDFCMFAFTVAENVAASDTYDREKVTACLEKVGLGEWLRGLKDGIDTWITRYYTNDGVDLSGGEAQKLAIARALYKDAPLVILDEPTASLDPIAESEIYAHFDTMVSGKTAIYISHRLSSCRFCDKIAVFDNGCLVQFGSHEELLSDETGKYHELWHAQEKYYVE